MVQFDFDKFYKENGFVVDFERTEETANVIKIDENAMEDDEAEEWYDNYMESLKKFAKIKGLKRYVWKISDKTDIFYARNKKTVVKYIYENYLTENGDGYSKKFVNENVECHS